MEIERKFLIRKMPDLTGIQPVHYERYYLHRDENVEERIQKKDSIYEYEYKKRISSLERTKEKRSLSESEFFELKQRASEAIIRDSYLLPSGVSIKIYHGKFEGLVRAEIEFKTREEATQYQPVSWMGEEITENPLGKDSKLLNLSGKEFYQMLQMQDNR